MTYNRRQNTFMTTKSTPVEVELEVNTESYIHLSTEPSNHILIKQWTYKPYRGLLNKKD